MTQTRNELLEQDDLQDHYVVKLICLRVSVLLENGEYVPFGASRVTQPSM